MAGTSRSGGSRKVGADVFPDSLPQCPSPWGKDERKVWNKLMKQIPQQLLKSADEYQLKSLCELTVRGDRLAELLKEFPADIASAEPYIKLNRAHLAIAQQVSRLSVVFGLSPLDRMRLNIEPEPEPELDDGEKWINS